VWIFWRRVWAKCLKLTCKTLVKIITAIGFLIQVKTEFQKSMWNYNCNTVGSSRYIRVYIYGCWGVNYCTRCPTKTDSNRVPKGLIYIMRAKASQHSYPRRRRGDCSEPNERSERGEENLGQGNKENTLKYINIRRYTPKYPLKYADKLLVKPHSYNILVYFAKYTQIFY